MGRTPGRWTFDMDTPRRGLLQGARIYSIQEQVFIGRVTYWEDAEFIVNSCNEVESSIRQALIDLAKEYRDFSVKQSWKAIQTLDKRDCENRIRKIDALIAEAEGDICKPDDS